MINAGSGGGRFRNLSRHQLGSLELPVATGLRVRLLGLALLDPEQAWPGLLIPNCRSIHTFGMRFALRVDFLDRHGHLVQRIDSLPPNRACANRHAHSVLELVPETEL